MPAKIIDSTIIYPSQPPFVDDHVLPLSHLDTDHNLNVTFRYLRVYVNSTSSQNHPKDPFDVITTALSLSLVPYYQFAGELRRRDSNNRLELHCQLGQGVPVVRANVDCQLKSINCLDDDIDDELVESLAPNPDPNEAMTHPMILQITNFKCGGFVLGASIYFALCDGIGATQFFNVMAEFVRVGGTAVQPVWDRQILLGPRKPPRIEFPMHEFLSLERGFVPYLQNSGGGRVVRRFFNVKDEWLDRLKSVLLNHSGSKFTTFEALGAFIWRARVKISKITENEKVKFSYQINIRKIVKPPLPIGYWGNGCVPMYIHLSAKDLLHQPLWKTANLIKKSKYDVSDEYVRSYIDFQELHFDEGITAGRRVSGFTDWRHLGHSSVDFGWGGPVTVFPVSKNLLGSVENCFFLPYSCVCEGRVDGFKVMVCVEEDVAGDFVQEMDRLNMKDINEGESI